MTKSTRLLALAMGLGVAFSVMGAGNPDAGQQKAAACMACHAPDGNSPVDMFPKLAGQVPEYLDKQLHDFKAGRRTNEMMSPQAQQVAEADIADISAYFAKQVVKPGASTKPDLLAAGQKIFEKGKGRPNVVAACIGCHGLTGGGNRDWSKMMAKPPAVLAPAIGGQHAGYLVAQLKAYKEGKRANDNASVMRNITARLDDKDIEAVAEYVSTLAR